MAYDLIQVGTGGRGAHWCGHILPPPVEDGLVNVVAAVDTDPDALENATEYLDLDESACYTDAATAFAEVDADCCTVVVPPWVRVECSGIGILGGFDEEHDPEVAAEDDAPILRITGVAIMGGVGVSVRYPGESGKEARRRRKERRRLLREGDR